jgi:hypothetical protein
MDAAGEFLFGASDLNTLDLPLPIPGQAKMGPKGTMAEGYFHVIARASSYTHVFLFRRLRQLCDRF